MNLLQKKEKSRKSEAGCKNILKKNQTVLCILKLLSRKMYCNYSCFFFFFPYKKTLYQLSNHSSEYKHLRKRRYFSLHCFMHAFFFFPPSDKGTLICLFSIKILFITHWKTKHASWRKNNWCLIMLAWARMLYIYLYFRNILKHDNYNEIAKYDWLKFS